MHDHGHAHRGDKRLVGAVLVNVLLTVALPERLPARADPSEGNSTLFVQVSVGQVHAIQGRPDVGQNQIETPNTKAKSVAWPPSPRMRSSVSPKFLIQLTPTYGANSRLNSYLNRMPRSA